MKNLLVLLAALMLLPPFSLTEAKTEAKIESVTKTDGHCYINYVANNYYKQVKGGYQIFSIDGKPLSDIYDNLSWRQNGLYYEYFSDSGMNNIGLLDCNGQVLVKPSYGKTTFYDDFWALAYVLEPTTNTVGDFKNRDNKQFMVVRTDVLYEGHIIGSLSRAEFNPSLRHGTAGKYFYVKTTSEAGYFIDRNFNIIRVEKDMVESEFANHGKKGVFHNPTQQWAFCDTCTLTKDDVVNSIWYNNQTDCLLDLQGNVIKSELVLDYAVTKGDYILFKMNGKYGVMDNQGNVIIKPNYKEIPGSPFTNRYQTAITEEGYLHYYDRQGNLTAKVEYPLSSNEYKGASSSCDFAIVKNMNKYIAITAVQGELPGTYTDYSSCHPKHHLLMVKKDDCWGAIDINGNTVLPFNYKSLTQSLDSTVVLARDMDGDYFIYKLTFNDDAVQPQKYGRVAQQSGATMTDAPVLAPGAWECACGTITTGKFCPECGTAKPTPTPEPTAEPIPTPTPEPTATPTPASVADGAWVCTCGSNNTGKFCPECGTPKPVAPMEPQCANCGYKPEGTAPKFCPECGTKF